MGRIGIYYENWQVKENNIYLTVISSLPHWNFSGEPGHLPIWLVGHYWSCALIPHFLGTASDTLPSAFCLCYFKRSKNNIGTPWSSPASESNSHSCTQKSINTLNLEPNEFRLQLPSSNPSYQKLMCILSSHLGLCLIEVHLPTSLLNKSVISTVNAT